jgi:hypothetical protein
MSVLLAIVFAFAGAVAMLAGYADIRRSRRLRETGQTAWAMTITPPGSAADRAEGPQRPYLQYTLGDGRVVEQVCPGSLKKATGLMPGQRVLIWYDPADPADILVHGRDSRPADRAFVLTGLALVLIGAVIGSFG